MTVEERASHLGFAIATYPDDALVEVYRSEIATAIRDALLQELGSLALACDGIAQGYPTPLGGPASDCADAIRERAAQLREGGGS